MAARGRKGTFAFDLSHPVKKGVLLKQGAFHKAFKYRFFLVYPGFLVYYDQESKWLLDLTKGETLGGRLGAIKLKDGSCNVARNAPKACKFGFIVHAPDPANKRPTYLINANSKQDRDEWIEAIRKSTPVSPKQKRKNEGSPIKMKEEPKNPEKEAVRPHPVSPVRQDTAAEAAAAVTENERLSGIDQSVTSSVTSSIDDSLQQPTLDVRRDTAATAALSLTVRGNKEDNSEDQRDTSIDDLLGPREENTERESDVSDQGSQNTTSPPNSNVQSPEPESERELDTGPESVLVNGHADEAETEKTEEEEEKEEDGLVTENQTTEEPGETRGEESSMANASEGRGEESSTAKAGEERGESATESSPMQSSEAVESQTSSNDDGEVVTTVTIECTGESNTTCSDNVCTLDKSRGANSAEAAGETEETVDSKEDKEDKKDDRGLELSTSEVHLTQDERSNSFSVTVNNIDTDDYSSSEEEGTELPPPPPTADETNGSPQTQEVTSSEDTPKVNGDTPTITVEKAEGDKGAESGETKSNGSSDSNTEGEKLIPLIERRRPSQAFIEKKGFLYKMGGKRKNWNLRYFVLQPGVFTYAKNPSSKVLGEVKLKNLQVFFPGIGERKTSFQFTIHTESTWNKRMDWVLAAQSEREMKDWITAFKLAGQKNMTPAGSDNELESSS